jgi:ATP-dependent Clp protease protease subunit
MNGANPIYIKFFAAVDGQSTNALMQVIDQKINEGAQKFVLLISSPGGSVFHGLSIYNFLCGIPAEVDTHNFGSVDSIGVCLFGAGRRRFSVPDARFLMHPVTLTFQGTQTMESEKLEEHLKGLRIDTENIAASIARTTGKSGAEIVKAMSDRTTLSPEQAKEFGLVHEIKSELFPPQTNLISINLS